MMKQKTFMDKSENNKDVSPGYTQEKTRIILSWIGSEKKVLDIGCFDGRESYAIKTQGNDVYGIDIMTSALIKAEKKGIKVFKLDLEKDKWPFGKNFFDIVLAGDIIEHLVNTDAFLEKIKYVLKPEGKLILSTPNLASLGRRLLLLFGKNPFMEVSKYDEINGFPSAGHLRYFMKDSLNQFLKFHGFIVEKFTSDGFNLGFLSSIRLAKIFPSLSVRFVVLAKKS